MFAIALFVYELQQRFLGPSTADVGLIHTHTPVLMLSDTHRR
jgi:hypothetical protein